MRTTVRLDEHLLAQPKKHAAESGKTVTAVLEQALRESLARRHARQNQAAAPEDLQGNGRARVWTSTTAHR